MNADAVWQPVAYDAAWERYGPPLPEGTPTPDPVAPALPARRLRDACEPIAAHAWWSRSATERMGELGLDFFLGYVWGRAAALGEPPAALVVATFAVFEPAFLSTAYEEARRRSGRADVLRVREEGATESLGRILSSADVGAVVAALRRALDAADVAGRPLFAGLRSLPWPKQPVGQLWRACELVREHRGDGHVAASIAAGLDPIAMNVLTELYVGYPVGEYTASRAWSVEAIRATIERLEADGLVADGRLTEQGRRFREELERRTDAMQQPIVDGLGSDFDPVVAQIDAWSGACIAAKAFPANALKRAAG